MNFDNADQTILTHERADSFNQAFRTVGGDLGPMGFNDSNNEIDEGGINFRMTENIDSLLAQPEPEEERKATVINKIHPFDTQTTQKSEMMYPFES